MTTFPRFRFLFVAGVALGNGIAHAQSNVVISGSLDAGVFRDTAKAWNVGTIQRSHLQFAGTEDLGDGLSALFKLRTRMDVDTGATEGAGSKPFWHGESTVGLKGGFGTVRLGRALDAIQSQDWAFDAWENYDRIASPAWDLWHWNYSADPHGGGSGRAANAVFYDSPSFANTALHVSYSPESVEGDVAKTRAASLVFNNGTIRAMAGAGKNSAGATEASYGLRGKIDALTLMGLYNLSHSAAGSKAKVTTLGALYDLGPTTLKAAWGQADVDGIKKERLFSLGASYAFSRRTAVYVEGASKRYPDDDAKSTYGVGITHSF
ncbi:porin [Ideonella sp. YS5]|uniref:porin n=1 Tax=Ideonella sp. YS5 TaxID=3453714 RepID=UPI003EEB55DB